jgi:hypothetical protein
MRVVAYGHLQLPRDHTLAATTYEHLEADVRDAEAALADDEELFVLY